MERQHHRVVFALSVASLVLAASPGFAQDEAEERNPELAARIFDVGVVHLREERYEQAAGAFRESYRADPRVETMCNLALTYDRWGGHRDAALRAYRTCARDDVGGRYRGYAERRVGEIERELALEAAADPSSEPDPVLDEDPGEGLPPEPTVEEPDHTVLYIGLAVGGLALVAMGVGIGTALESQAIVDELHDRLGPMPVITRGTDDHDRLEQAMTLSDVATSMYVLMGSMLAASGAMILVDLVVASSNDGSSARLVPAGPGLALVGRY